MFIVAVVVTSHLLGNLLGYVRLEEGDAARRVILSWFLVNWICWGTYLAVETDVSGDKSSWSIRVSESDCSVRKQVLMMWSLWNWLRIVSYNGALVLATLNVGFCYRSVRYDYRHWCTSEISQCNPSLRLVPKPVFPHFCVVPCRHFIFFLTSVLRRL